MFIIPDTKALDMIWGADDMEKIQDWLSFGMTRSVGKYM